VTIPTLPGQDSDPQARAALLEKARSAYQYDFSRADILFAAEVPQGAGDPLNPRYIAQAAEINARVEANKLAWTARGGLEALAEDVEVALNRRGGVTTVQGRPGELNDYAQAIALLPDPLCLKIWNEDWSFGWQRVAGENAHMLQQVGSLPDHFPVTEAQFQRAFGTRAEDDSLEGALAEGRAYLVDYAALKGIPLNVSGGVQHYMYAPLGLFCVEKTGARRLLPVAVQCAQAPGPGAPVFTPGDGRRWSLAKQCFQVADMTVHGQVYHFGYCHILLEALILSSHRTLSERHPVLTLLRPHFEMTLGANDVAKDALVSRGGYIDRLLGGSLDAGNELMKNATRAVTWRDLVPSREFEQGGTDDLDLLPDFPWRDDGLLSWPIVHDFVKAYLNLYYTADGDVGGDEELMAWVDEIAEGARLPALIKRDELQTKDALASFVAGIIYRATVYHAAINYAGYDWQLFGPNKAGSGYAPAPTATTVDDDDALRAMLPPMDLILLKSKLLLQQRELKLTRMLHYDHRAFGDKRVTPLVERAQAALNEVDSTIAYRNVRRPIDYVYASPNQVPNSIMV